MWRPYLKKHIHVIENLQRGATKVIPGFKKYEDRLIPTLKYRRLSGDIIEVYKILHGVYDGEVTAELLNVTDQARTHGHPLKLSKDRSRLEICNNFFTSRDSEW